MLSKLGKLCDGLLVFAAVLAGIMIIFLMLSVSMEVALRYFFGRPTSWVVEIAGYILLYLPFLVAAWVLKREDHVTMDLLLNLLNPSVRAMLNAITSGISAIICLIVAWAGLRSSMFFHSVNYRTPTVLMLPKALISAIIFIGCFLLFIQFIRRGHGYMKMWRGMRERGNDSEEPVKEPGPQPGGKF